MVPLKIGWRIDMKNYDCELYDWSISASQVMRKGIVSICGCVLGDTKNRFEDHTRVSTSEVVELDLNEMVAVTKTGTVYKLLVD